MNPWLVALVALTGLRLVLAAILPLSPDEAYYWVWSRNLQPGYLDHPPMVAIFIWLGTALLGDSALGVRLLGPVSLFIGSLMLARTAEGLRLRQRLGWLLRKLFTGEAGQRVKLSLPYRGCAIDVSILLGTVVTYS